MKKFFASLMVALAVLMGSNVLLATSAQATTVSSSVSQVSAAKSASVSPETAVAPPNAVTAPFNLAGGGGGIRPVWLYVSCYWAMNGYYYCWRYACTNFDRVALGCYNGWYRVPTRIYV